MDIPTIVSLISSVGFPIAMTLVLLWYIVKLNAQHKEEIDELRKSVDNNTKVLQELCIRWDADKR